VTVLGLTELLANLERHREGISEASKSGLMEAADRIKDAWVNNIIADDLILTGHYRDSVRVTSDGEVVGVVSDVAYGGILEYGDSRQAAHYPATRAADEHHEEVLDAVHEHVGRAL